MSNNGLRTKEEVWWSEFWKNVFIALLTLVVFLILYSEYENNKNYVAKEIQYIEGTKLGSK